MWYTHPHLFAPQASDVLTFSPSITPRLYARPSEDHLSTFCHSASLTVPPTITTTFRRQSLPTRRRCFTLPSAARISFKIPSPQKDFAF